MSSLLQSALLDDGTVTTQENDQHQDEMIESLFSAENFSEVDTCVEIMSSGPRTSVKSHRSKSSSYHSGASTSRKSKKNDQRSLKAEKIKMFKQIPMQPIDEDVHKMVREDVRKMIAKIRAAKQPKPVQSHAEDGDEEETTEESEADKMLVNPGKYGECDLRYAGAQARKEMFDKIKQDNIKKRSSSKRAEDSEASGTEDGSTSHQPIMAEQWIKKGYYKNHQSQESPEQLLSTTGSKSKSEVLSFAVQDSSVSVTGQDSSESAADEGSSVSVASSKKSTSSRRSSTSQRSSAVSTASRRSSTSKRSSATNATSNNQRSSAKESRKPITSRLQVEVGRQADDEELFECILAPSRTFTTINEENEVLLPTTPADEEPNIIERDQGNVEIPDKEEATTEEPEPEASLATPEVEEHNEDYVLEPDSTTETSDVELNEDPVAMLRPDPSGEIEQKNTRSDLRLNRSVSSLHPVPEDEPCIAFPEMEPTLVPEKETDQKNDEIVTTNVKGPITAPLPILVPLILPKEVLSSVKPGVLITKAVQEILPVSEPMVLPALSDIEPVTTNLSKVEESLQTATLSLQATTQQTSDQSDAADLVELILVDDSVKLKQLEEENAKLKDTLRFLQRTAVSKEKYFAELAWFGKRNEAEVQKWRPNFWNERLEDLGPDLFEEFRADAIRIADPDIGDWEHGFSSGALAMSRLLLGLSHASEDEQICAFHDLGEACTQHCITSTVAQQRHRELEDFPVLDP